MYTALAQTLGSEIKMKLLATPESARKVARWFVQQGILQQFNTAKEIEEREEAEGCDGRHMETKYHVGDVE